MYRLAAIVAVLVEIASAQPAGVVAQQHSVPMRDGVLLSANLFRPPAVERGPVLLIRTPYGKGRDLLPNHRHFVEQGYLILVQDVRGRYASGGVFEPLGQEGADGDDTLNWIGRQPWSNGRVGMLGGSYLGIVQWKAALTGNRYLKAIFPVVSGYDDYLDRFGSTGGALKLGNRLLWMSANLKARGFKPPDFSLFVNTLPVVDADLAATGQRVAMFQTALAHPAYDGFWRSISTRERLADVKVPVYSVGGWYDNFVQSDLEAFSALRKLGRQAYTLIGPWPHNMSMPFEGEPFGPNARAPIGLYQLRWFDRWLRDKTVPEQAPLRIFVMGANVWREEREWPLARAVPSVFYLGEKMERRPPKKARVDRFAYDPSKPVPTRGGGVCCNPQVFPWGPMDQREVEKRADVLVYSTPVLERDLEVTGPVKANLFVSTSATDTDFTVKLVDVYPDGRAMNLTDGILRLRYREGLDKAVLAEPGKVYAITVDAGVTSNVFRAGHRIRVEISSSNFPRFDRNLNTGGPIGQERRGVTAQQAVYVGGSQASAIMLPVVP